MEATNKYKDVTFGTSEAVFNKLGGIEGIARFLSSDLIVTKHPVPMPPRRVNIAKLTELADPDGTVSTQDIEKCLEPKWVEENGVIYLTLPMTTGRTGEEWITHFKKKGDRLSSYAEDVLRSKKFKPTKGVVNKIAVLKGELWQDDNRITKIIRQDAYAGTHTKGHKLTDPNAEVGCLIRDYLTDEEIAMLGLWWIVAMHNPIPDSVGVPDLLSASRGGGGRWLRAFCGGPGYGWGRDNGFAFVLSQV